MINAVLNDRYRIQSEIGRGGMGIVFRAEDTLLERPVAVKVVSTTGLGTEGRSRLLQEARATARLNHPNIVAVYDVGQVELAGREGQSSYIVMELVEGQTLRESNPQDLNQIIDLTGHICEALTAAHRQGIIHRDLKPENVAVTQGNTVKLMDFGLARISGQTRLTQEGTLMGTLSYLAPEVILGQEAGPRSDLYALGVMLYEMSAGRPPFEADNLTAVISQHLHAPVVPPSAYNERIPAALDRLIVQLLSKRPEDRPPSAEAVRTALEDISTAGDVPQTPVPVSQLDRLVRGRMVGREAEFSEAVSLWRNSATGNGQLLLISGEPGIGKTRMVKELKTYAEISGGKALFGFCFAEERRPYGPIAQMVQTSLDDGFNLELPQPVLADLMTLSPELQLAYPDIPANERLDPEAEQQRLFDSIITWFGALNKAGELLLVVEDVHWADSGSLALLRYLARRLSRRRALVVATYREVELDEALPFRELLRDLNRERLAPRIKLSRLDKEQTRVLLAALFAEEITPEFLDGIYRETEGNPLFIEEVCKTLVDNGKLVYEDGHWRRPDDIVELEIPQGIRLTIQSRLSKLSDEEQTTLQLAALLGREFEYDLLVAVSDLGEDQLIDALENAEKAQIIEEIQYSSPGANPNFLFTHALIHSTLLSNLSTLRRQRQQRQVALALESNFPDRRKELATLLGRYFAEAGDGDKGVTYLLSAGDSAREVFAYDEAIEAYEQALLFLKEWGDHERTARTLMKLGLTYHNIFAFDLARKAYEQGFAEWQRAAESESLDALRSPAPHPFRAVVGSDPSSLDPALDSDAYSMWCIRQLFSGLLQLTADDELVPDVAQSWEVLDDGRTYIFHLRIGVKWSDGEPVTAVDFEYAWKRALHPDNDQGLSEILFDIVGSQAFKNGLLDNPDEVGVKATDEYTLLVNLESPSSYFLQLMASAVFMPIPRHLAERLGPAWTEPANIVTNGPFTLKSLDPGQSMIFERFEDYHGRFKGNISQVDLKTVPPGEAALEMYDRNEIDILYPYGHLSLRDARRAVQRHPDDYISGPNPMTLYLAFNVRKPPFDDPKVRRALVLAMDRETLVNTLTQGINFPAGGGLVPSGIAGHVPGIALPYDPTLARQTLAEAGFPGGQGLPPVEGLGSGNPRIKLLEGLAAGWKTNLGLQMSIEHPKSFDEFNERLDGDPPNMWLMGWTADYPDPDSFLRYCTWLRHTGWHNEQYEALIQDARRIADQRQRMAMYRQAEQILVAEAPVVPINYGRLHVLVKPWLPGLPASTINGNILKDIIIEPH